MDTIIDGKLDFEQYTEEYLNKSMLWLNDPILKKLTNTPDFNKDMQMQWFKSLPQKTDYFIRGIRLDGVPIGACGLKHISNIDAELWCYIGEASVRGKGIGRKIMDYLIDSGRKFKLMFIKISVIPTNTIARHLYESYGFKKIGEDKQYVYMLLKL